MGNQEALGNQEAKAAELTLPPRTALAARAPIIKVRAGFYRCGAYCIHKGHWWCVYHGARFLPDARFRTLQEAGWWAQKNQPKPALTSGSTS